MATLKGIDVSYSNANIDWKKVKQSNQVDFAIIRSSFGSESPSQIDNQFDNNAKGCIDNNIPFATYHFAYFVDEKTAISEAEFALKMANKYKDKVKFITLDIEEDTERYANNQGYRPNWTKCAIAFMEKVKQGGYIPVLYVNQNWLISKLDYDKVKNYKLWYAAVGVSSPKYNPAVWQYSWTGRINGIKGDVDMDYCYDNTLFSGKTTSSSTAVSKPMSKPLSENSQTNSSATVNYSVKVTSSDGVNIRNGAGTSYSIKGAVPYNTTLKVTKQTSGGGYTWGYITYNGVTGWIALDFTSKVDTTSVQQIKKGSKVKVKAGSKAYDGTTLASFVFNTTYTVMEINGNRVVIGINGQVTAAIKKENLILV